MEPHAKRNSLNLLSSKCGASNRLSSQAAQSLRLGTLTNELVLQQANKVNCSISNIIVQSFDMLANAYLKKSWLFVQKLRHHIIASGIPDYIYTKTLKHISVLDFAKFQRTFQKSLKEKGVLLQAECTQAEGDMCPSVYLSCPENFLGNHTSQRIQTL